MEVGWWWRRGMAKVAEGDGDGWVGGVGVDGGDDGSPAIDADEVVARENDGGEEALDEGREGAAVDARRQGVEAAMGGRVEGE